jgi:hypothetical protein
MRLELVNAQSYSPLDLLKVWKEIAASMDAKVPAVFNCEDFLLALLGADNVRAHAVLAAAQRIAESQQSHQSQTPTPIDFTADTAGQLWGLSFTHEKAEEPIFATTITLLCTADIAPEDQPPLRSVCANQLWIDANPQLEIEPPVRIAGARKLLELLNAGLLEDDQNLAESSLRPEGSAELLQLATLPHVQPLIKFLEGKLSQ